MIGLKNRLRCAYKWYPRCHPSNEELKMLGLQTRYDRDKKI